MGSEMFSVMCFKSDFSDPNELRVLDKHGVCEAYLMVAGHFGGRRRGCCPWAGVGMVVGGSWCWVCGMLMAMARYLLNHLSKGVNM